MKRATVVLLLLAACAGSEDPMGPDALCIAVVNVHGVFYGTGPTEPVDPASVSTEPYVTVSLNSGCLDQGEPPVELQHGQSNFLDVGTTLHTVDGYEPSDRLVHWSDVVDEWLVLSPLP